MWSLLFELSEEENDPVKAENLKAISDNLGPHPFKMSNKFEHPFLSSPHLKKTFYSRYSSNLEYSAILKRKIVWGFFLWILDWKLKKQAKLSRKSSLKELNFHRWLKKRFEAPTRLRFFRLRTHFAIFKIPQDDSTSSIKSFS